MGPGALEPSSGTAWPCHRRLRHRGEECGANLGGLAGDHRLAVVAVRKIHDMADAAKSLGIRKTMEVYPLRDDETGLELSGIAWQEAGTGVVYLSAAVLFGVGVGNQGGAAGTKTDYAGCLIRTI